MIDEYTFFLVHAVSPWNQFGRAVMGGGLIILQLLVIRAHGPPPGGNSSNSTQPVVDGMGACGGTAWWWQANAAVPLAVGSKFKSDDDLDTQPILHPPWGFLVPQHGHVCTDASTSHAPHQQNNTRNSFWALPSGPPPQPAAWGGPGTLAEEPRSSSPERCQERKVNDAFCFNL